MAASVNTLQPFASYVASLGADDSFKVFPCVPNQKRPACAGGFKDATANQEVLRDWASKLPDANIGHCPEDSGHFVLDVDPKNGGDESLGGLIAQYGLLPATYVIITPSGGKHYWFVGSAPSSAGKIGNGLDIRGRSGYVLIEGSRTAAGAYVCVDDTPAAPAPEWLVDAVCASPNRAAISSPFAGTPFTPAELTGMISYLDPDCGYEEWRDIAAALHASPCTDESFDRRDLFVRWSRGEVRHEP